MSDDDEGNFGGYHCPACGAKRVTAGLLEQHIRREHPGMEEW